MSNAQVLPLLEPDLAPCCPPLDERPLTGEEAVRTAAMFKALSDPVRLRLFSAVASHHLKKLKDAGLLTSERRATWVHYCVEPSVLAAMGHVLGR